MTIISLLCKRVQTQKYGNSTAVEFRIYSGAKEMGKAVMMCYICRLLCLHVVSHNCVFCVCFLGLILVLEQPLSKHSKTTNYCMKQILWDNPLQV